MRAVAFTVNGERSVEVPSPEPADDEVLLDVGYCGICGSDLHAGEPDFRPGTIMGHEFSGTIVEVGSNVTGWGPGDRVVVNPNGDWCGRCHACHRGWTNMCGGIWETAIGLARNGGLAEQAAVRARTLYRLPDEVSLRHGAWVEPLAVALRTVRRSEVSIGDDAVVFGAGPIGLLVTTLLDSTGVSSITVVEPSAGRRQVALSQGASRVIDPASEDLSEIFPDPMSAPAFAYECTGVPEVLSSAVSVVRPRGRVAVTGFARRDPHFSAADLLFKEVDIRGSFIYTDEFGSAIALLASGAVDVGPLATSVVPLSNAQEAFDGMRRSSDVVKHLISPLNGHIQRDV